MPFAGFDALAYPGDPLMTWLKANTNLGFVGFYLAPAPSRPTSAWMDKRAALAAQGWGFAPVYVGQQEQSQPGAHVLTPAQGALDAGDASGLMARAGFPANSVVYLDCEQGGPASAAVQGYVAAWFDALSALGTFTPGIYCSHTTAASLLALRAFTRVWTWNLVDLKPAAPSFPSRDPAGSGVSQATLWQYAQNVTIALPGAPVASLRVDLDCASVADPSQPAPPPAAPAVA